MFYIIKLNPVNKKAKTVFKISLYKILSSGRSRFIEKLGYYDTDYNKKIISLKTDRVGFWLNKGAKLNYSVYKILKRLCLKS
jgi:ribosomal protein S16